MEKLHSIHSACFWIERQLKITSASYYTLLGESANKYFVSEDSVDKTFSKMYPNLIPLQPLKEGS